MFKYENTYCNPIKVENLPRGYGAPKNAKIPSHRSLSDPTLFYYNDKWYMYPSYEMAFVSEDFKTWKHTPIEPLDLYWAPTIWEYNGEFYLMGRDPYVVYKGDNPLGPFAPIGDLKNANGNPLEALDAMFFVDDDNRVYLYWTSNPLTICGVEINPETMCDAIGEPVEIIKFNGNHTWECHGARNQNTTLGWMEGAWMQKIGNRYFLIYSGCGTQFGTYAMGAYYSDKGPLEGFVYQKNNPICLNPYGLVRGGGHGSVVKGPKDTLWIFYTSPISYVHPYERRVGMDPIALDENGELCRVVNSDVPMWAPGVKENPFTDGKTDLLPLTINMPIEASSCVDGRDACYATDESVLTWWQPKSDDPIKSITINLRSEYNVSAMRIYWRDIGIDYENGVLPGPFKYKVELSEDGENWVTVVDKSENSVDYANDYEPFETTKATFARLVILGSPKGIEPGVIDFTVFGTHI